MLEKMIVFTAIRFLHDLATAVWVGGLIAMALAVLPAARELFGRSPQTRRLMQAVQGRLRVLVYASIIVLVTTGALMSRRSPQFLGLLSWANPYSAALAWKHLLVVAMVVVALVRSLAFGPIGRREPAGALDASASPRPMPEKAPGALRVQDRISVLLLLLNGLLGVAVVLLSALTATLRGGPPA